MEDSTKWQWYLYPMGPILRTWLGLSPEDHENLIQTDISPDQRQTFTDHVLSELKLRPVADEPLLIDLADELIAMDLPLLVLKTFDIAEAVWTRRDFRGLRAEGIASMLAGERDRAIQAFADAQGLYPDEPAPYANLAKIFLSESRFDEAWSWLETGLKTDPNHFEFWQIAAYIANQSNPGTSGQVLLNLARKHLSWAGLSLSAELLENRNADTKALLLQEIYDQGERSHEFLTEYTGALGEAGLFEKIPVIVWQAEKLSQQELPWQLLVHKLQSYLELEQYETFIEQGQLALSGKSLPPEIKNQLKSVIEQHQNEESRLPH
jgi:tetratricopeptide (TPR) repeat protein